MKRYYFIALVALAGCYSSASDPIQRTEIPQSEGEKIEFVDYEPVLEPVEIVKIKSPLFGKSLARVRGHQVYRASRNEVEAISFVSGLAVDADGSPRAYHPNDTGLDYLQNAGQDGNWWALATENGEKDGNPVVQGENDPAPGYYVSMTSLSNPSLSDSDPNKYVNAEEICYFVLPPKVKDQADVWLGDIAMVYNIESQKYAFAIFADIGPDHKIGEGSIKLAEALGINSSPKIGGAAGGVLYLVFPNSGNNLPRTQEEIDEIGKQMLDGWGGLADVKEALKAYIKPAKPIIDKNSVVTIIEE